MSIAYLILDNIRSAHNVGAIFRTADGAGVTKIFLVETTPCPIDRFGRAQKEIAKTALGAEKTMIWEHQTNFTALVRQLKKEDFKIIAVEQSRHSTDYRKIKPTAKMALVFGEEVSGIPPAHLKLCDVIAEIPMRGKKESLNVSVAVGIALFQGLGI